MLLRDVRLDLQELSRVSDGLTARALLPTLVLSGSFSVLALNRLREGAGALHLASVARLLGVSQEALYGIEIGKDVKLGHGVWFVHPSGTVIEGTSRIGDRVRFMGDNVVGALRGEGYPIIDDDVFVGTGARILGPVRIGARAVIGANALVLQDVPKGGLAMGIPATLRDRYEHGRPI